MIAQFAEVRCDPSTAHLSESDAAALAEIVEAAKPLNRIYAKQTHGSAVDLLDFLDAVDVDGLPAEMREPFTDYRSLVHLHYGPHDSASYQKFVPGFSRDDFENALENPDDSVLRVMFDSDFEAKRSPGANVYQFDSEPTPEIIEWIRAGAKQEAEGASIDKLVDRTFTDPFSVARVDTTAETPQLTTVPYHQEYAEELRESARHLLSAAELVDDATFSLFLHETARGLLTGEYRARDLLLLDVDQDICLTLGPIETYLDKLAGVKAAFEAIVSVRDVEGTKRLSTFADLTPDLIESLPCDAIYKNRTPPEKAPLDLANVVYLAGSAAEGSKAIAHALPNDEMIINARGYRKTIFMNLVDAKARAILLPIAKVVLGEDMVEQYGSDTLCDAFLWHVISHESSHPLGRTRDGLNSDVRSHLREHYSPIEECKADTLGLYNLDLLVEKRVLSERVRDAAYVSYTAGVFRSIRLGAQSAHARANLMFLNYQIEQGGINVTDDGLYVPDPGRFQQSVTSLAREILTIEGEGDYSRARDFSNKYGGVSAQTNATLDKIASAGIPVDIHTVFRV